MSPLSPPMAPAGASITRVLVIVLLLLLALSAGATERGLRGLCYGCGYDNYYSGYDNCGMSCYGSYFYNGFSNFYNNGFSNCCGGSFYSWY